MKYDSILDVVGHTPAVRLRSFDGHAASALWVKLESFNQIGRAHV
jgi:cysteine synthase